MPLTVLSIGYPFAAVGPDAVGGAEQVLSALDHALVEAGHNSIVVSNSGSQVAGTLIPIGPIPADITDQERARSRERHRCAIAQALAEFPVDLVHSHAVNFAEHPPETDTPALVTLHLPRDFYPPGSFDRERPQTWYNCVSASQRRSFPPMAGMLPQIENGVPVDRLQAHHARRNFALCLGRICPEKGFEHALDAARLADLALLIGGELFPYEWHRQLFCDRDQTASGPQSALSRPGWLGAQAPLAECGMLLIGAEPGAGNKLIGRNGSHRLRDPGCRVSRRGARRDSRTGGDWFSG